VSDVLIAIAEAGLACTILPAGALSQRGIGAQPAMRPIVEPMMSRPVSVCWSHALPISAAALRECGVRDGATLSFHHHLRNGDHLMNLVLAEAARLGLRDLKIAPSSIFPVHAPWLGTSEPVS
jgi:hypothetical protein